MERVKLLSGNVTVEECRDTEGVGYNLTFEVEQNSASDKELEHYFRTGELFPLVHRAEHLAVSLRSQSEQGPHRVYEGVAGFLRPGMGSGGG
ncbi:hypothetical protein [Lacipirellula sp.]|uniref:hypothetical protein n=1 Tax=Lacipirellula sp. TaxID=2691419 RepID=UPI003D0AFB90